MYKHPFVETPYRKIAISLIGCLVASLYAVLLCLYGDISLQIALGDAALSVFLLAILGFFFWFIVDFIRVLSAGLLFSAVALLLWLVGCFTIQLLDYPLDEYFVDRFLFLLPLRFCLGCLLWFGMLQWYKVVKLNRWKAKKIFSDSIQEQAQANDHIDRIAVKSGSHIHVIPVKDLIHIQACGDYAMLFTGKGQFLKEQTMKSLEYQLPDNFIRIHRSFIVNVEQIDRVELYGKESYRVILKNGSILRASISGYKQLKEQLSL